MTVDTAEEYVIAPAPVASVAVAGTDARFPVRRIYCVGRNYLDHIREMKGDERQPPFFFQKPADSIVPSGTKVPIPPKTDDFQHEIELVLAIGGTGASVPVDAAADLIFGLAVGIDLTRRDLQLEARNAGRPWESGKSFDRSAPISAIHRLGSTSALHSGRIALSVNGTLRQQGDLADMIWSCEEVVSQLSMLYELQPGDLIFTGTPAGVGKLQPGDVVVGEIDGLDRVEIVIA